MGSGRRRLKCQFMSVLRVQARSVRDNASRYIPFRASLKGMVDGLCRLCRIEYIQA